MNPVKVGQLTYDKCEKSLGYISNITPDDGWNVTIVWLEPDGQELEMAYSEDEAYIYTRELDEYLSSEIRLIRNPL